MYCTLALLREELDSMQCCGCVLDQLCNNRFAFRANAYQDQRIIRNCMLNVQNIYAGQQYI